MLRLHTTIRVCFLLAALQGLAHADSFSWVDPGTKIAGASSGDLTPVNLGISFQLFGNTYTSATVSAQGYLAFTGNQTPSELSVLETAEATDANMAHSDVVRIAPGWWNTEVIDQNPTDAAAGIFLNTGTVGQTVITWVNMGYYIPPSLASGAVYPAPDELSTFQVVLRSDGSVTFNYKELNVLNPANGHDNSLDSSPQLIMGIGNNDGSTPYSSANLTAAALGQATFTTCEFSNCESTVYQTIANPIYAGGNGVQLQSQTITFNQIGQNGWYVSSGGVQPTSDVSAPEPATFELLLAFVSVGVIFRRKLTHC